MLWFNSLLILVTVVVQEACCNRRTLEPDPVSTGVGIGIFIGCLLYRLPSIQSFFKLF